MSFVQQFLLTLEQFFTALARMCANAKKPAVDATNAASKLTEPPLTQPQEKTAASKLTEPPVTQPQKKTVYCVDAVGNQDFPLLRQLLKDGADVNAAPEGSAGPLEIAATRGNVEMTKFLLQQGAELDYANSHGCTALHLAILYKLLPVAYALLEAGADTKLKTKNGNTAFDIAKDDAAKCLLNIYASGGRPSWLARELYQRGLTWDVIAAVNAKMQKEGYSTREALAVMPLTSFTDAYLKYDIGITSALAREMIFQIRVESTWLGKELTRKGVNAANIAVCEKIIIDEWSRTNKALFGSLKITDLTSLPEITARHVQESLVELHREVSKKHQKGNKKSLPTAAPHTETKTKPKPKTKTKTAIAVSSTVPAIVAVATAPTAMSTAPAVSPLTSANPAPAVNTKVAAVSSTVSATVAVATAPTAVSSVPAVSPLKSFNPASAVNTKVATMVFSTVLAPVAVATAPTAVSSVPSGTSLTPTNPVPFANRVEIIPGTVMKSPAQSESSNAVSAALTNDVTAEPHLPAVEPAVEPTADTPAETHKGERTVPIVQHIDAGGAVSGESGAQVSSAEGDGAQAVSESENGCDDRDSGTWEHL